jgi:hypothetical protein
MILRIATLSAFFLFLILPNMIYAIPPGMGFGKCHSAGPQLNDSGVVNWYYNGGYEESWKEF